MSVIGLTGGIGSGKSRVALAWCRHFSVDRIDADAVCRELLQPGGSAWSALRQRIGVGYCTAAGELDRRLLRGAIFADAALRRQVEDIIHPLAREEIRRRLRVRRHPLVLVEVPLLYEAGWQDMVDRVVLVYAEPWVRLERIVARDRLTQGEAEQALAAQPPLEEKILLADHVVDNGGVWSWTLLQLFHLGKMLAGRQLLSASPSSFSSVPRSSGTEE
ncbi:MAG: dephospho-CoA kinase [Desulfobulbaceae bacterium A2]|nr:MAG: dephospho-CoA kinase [Desulfobulbaceae bacterium A2]